MEATKVPDFEDVMQLFGVYAAARATFLGGLGLATSNRDPLAEFSEALVAFLLSGKLAASRVQKDYDLVAGPHRERVQVKYLANATATWVNEHTVRFTEGMDAYALVVFEAFAPVAVLVFPRKRLAILGAALGKRHRNQDATLQITRRTFARLLADPTAFAELGVRIFLPPYMRLAMRRPTADTP